MNEYASFFFLKKKVAELIRLTILQIRLFSR